MGMFIAQYVTGSLNSLVAVRQEMVRYQLQRRERGSQLLPQL